MKPQKQLLRHNPAAGIFGDCCRTAIAIALDMDARNVPHFMDGGASGDAAWDRAEAWLNARGLSTIAMVFDGTQPLQKVLDTIAAVNQRGKPVFLLTGTSKNGCNHIVVACNGDIVCDPSLDESGIVGPAHDGYWWVTFFGSLAATDNPAKLTRDAASQRDRLDRAAAKLSTELIAAGMGRGDFYITIGQGELHVYAKVGTPCGHAMEAGLAVLACEYPVEWHIADIDVRPVETAEAAE